MNIKYIPWNQPQMRTGEPMLVKTVMTSPFMNAMPSLVWLSTCTWLVTQSVVLLIRKLRS